MTYTEEAKQALSRKVARKFDIDACVQTAVFVGEPETLWLHDDWHILMELCVKHGVNAVHGNMETGDYPFTDVEAFKFHPDGVSVVVNYADCNNDPSLAERIARLLALGEI